MALISEHGYVSKRNMSHTQTHDKNNTTDDHTKDHPPHLTTIEGGAVNPRCVTLSVHMSGVTSDQHGCVSGAIFRRAVKQFVDRHRQRVHL